MDWGKDDGVTGGGSKRENYIELHRNSDHTDPRVQARWSVPNLK